MVTLTKGHRKNALVNILDFKDLPNVLKTFFHLYCTWVVVRTVARGYYCFMNGGGPVLFQQQWSVQFLPFPLCDWSVILIPVFAIIPNRCSAAVWQVLWAISLLLAKSCPLHALSDYFVQIALTSIALPIGSRLPLSLACQRSFLFSEFRSFLGISFTSILITSLFASFIFVKLTYVLGPHLPEICVSVCLCGCKRPFVCLSILNWCHECL